MSSALALAARRGGPAVFRLAARGTFLSATRLFGLLLAYFHSGHVPLTASGSQQDGGWTIPGWNNGRKSSVIRRGRSFPDLQMTGLSS